MTWILIGSVFAVLNFNIPFGPGAIGILPDFLGYILIIFGMLSMERQVDYLSGHFKKSIRFAAVLVLMGVVDYVRVLTGWNMGGLEILILWGTSESHEHYGSGEGTAHCDAYLWWFDHTGLCGDRGHRRLEFYYTDLLHKTQV